MGVKGFNLRPVTQTILHEPVLSYQGIYGNCLQAAIASFLGLPLDAVPHFVLFAWYKPALELWARGRGMTVREKATTGIPGFPCIVGGASERGIEHVCIAAGGRIVWDVHPSRAGLVTITDAMWFEPWPDEDRTCWMCDTPWKDPA